MEVIKDSTGNFYEFVVNIYQIWRKNYQSFYLNLFFGALFVI